jgi:hypothetical protein
MAHINLYMNNPTAGATDGTAISSDGTNPLVVSLDAGQNESKTVKLAVRTDSGYVTTGSTFISDYCDSKDKWKLSLTENGDYADSITISNVVSDVNTIFYAKAFSARSESAAIDRSVSLRVRAVVNAV